MATTIKFSPTPNRPPSQYSQSANLYTKRSPLTFSPYHATILRDNFTLPTWFLLGCLLQYTLTLLLRPSLAILPVLLLLAYSLLNTLLQTLSLTSNPWSTGVIPGRLAAAFPGPDERTAVSGTAQNGPGAIMILGARSHSPVGMFAPGSSSTYFSSFQNPSPSKSSSPTPPFLTNSSNNQASAKSPPASTA